MATASTDKKSIVIIGGGIIGATSAYFLTRHPAFNPAKHKITLLEASKIAGGASGKAGGLLALWAYPSSIVPLSYKLHAELAAEHDGAERWGYRKVHCGQIDCVGRPIRTRPRVAGKDGEMDGQNGSVSDSVSLQKRSKEALGKLRAAGVPADLDWVDAESLRLYDEMGDPSTTAQVHPYQFTTSMAALAQEKGAEIKEGASVKSINYSADGKAVKSVTYTDTLNGDKTETIEVSDVIVAAGPWTRSVLPEAPISALRAHSVTIRPSRPVSAYALFTQIKLPSNFEGKGKNGRGSQIVTPEIYARPKNEVYACGEGDHLVPLPPTSAAVQVDESRCQDIVDYVASISDELRDGEVTARQACYLPNVNASGSGGPLIGKTGVKGLILASGHTCWVRALARDIRVLLTYCRASKTDLEQASLLASLSLMARRRAPRSKDWIRVLLCSPSGLVVLPPVVLLFETKHFSDLSIAQRCLPLSHLTSDRRVWGVLLEKLRSWDCRCDGVVCGVEDLESHAILLDTQITDLSQITSVDVTPGITLPRLRLSHVLGKISFVFVRLNDIANSKSIDICTWISPAERASGLLATDFAQGIGIHRIDVVVFL